MTMTPSERFARSVMFKARSVKEALAEARQVFGDDAVILSVERVGSTYCVEASGAELLAPETRAAPAAKPIARAEPPIQGRRDERARNSSGIELSSDHLMARLEEKFDRAMAQMAQTRGGAPQSGASAVRLALLKAGYTDPLCLELEASAARFGGAKEGLIKALAQKIEQLPKISDPLVDGGVFALVGPTGSGKTTTVAKIAAKAVTQWGSNAVALITADFYRIGAYEHLRIYGELLGIPVRRARSMEDLAGILGLAKSKKLILIDTIGSARFDHKVDEQMLALTSLGAECLFSLQASLSPDVFRADISRWQALGAHGAVLTKLDEAVGIGPLVQTCLLRGLPITHVSNGQRVPDDLHRISPMLLAHRSLRPQND